MEMVKELPNGFLNLFQGQRLQMMYGIPSQAGAHRFHKHSLTVGQPGKHREYRITIASSMKAVNDLGLVGLFVGRYALNLINQQKNGVFLWEYKFAF